MANKWALVLAPLLVSGGVVVGCGSDVESRRGDNDDGFGGVTNPDPASYVGAAGVNVAQVNIYQGPERILAIGHTQQQSPVPLVAGRDALVRVFYQSSPEQVGKTVLARLEIAGQEPLESEIVVGPSSTQESFESTINFIVPGDMIGEVFEYRVSLLEEGNVDNLDAHHPVEGLEAHAVQGPQNKLRVMMVPFQYNADGSGRVPDLSPEAAEIYRRRFLQLYPVSNVEIAVREPVAWNQQISPFGQGWQEVGQTLVQIRETEKPSDDWYYYAIFQPTQTASQFCAQGCLLGVTLLNDTPVDTGNPTLRIALGVGFPSLGPDTAAHEIGHAHGRAHADCGPGLDPQSIDFGFPHPGGGIGPWSWDIVNQQPINPVGRTDIMGYCDNQWISDYNYGALLNRGQFVNLPKYQAPESLAEQVGPIDYDLISVDGMGETRFQQTITRTPLPASPTVTVRLENDGDQREVGGHFYRYDHLPGGWLLVPSGDFDAERAIFELDGVTRQVTLP